MIICFTLNTVCIAVPMSIWYLKMELQFENSHREVFVVLVNKEN